MRILYFAWLRERMNKGSEELEVPSEVTTIAELMDWKAANDESFELGLSGSRNHPRIRRRRIGRT